MSFRSMLIACSAAILAASSNVAAHDVESVYYGKSNDFYEALDNNLIVIHSNFTGEPSENWVGSPLEGATTRCFGSITIIRGIPSGGGNCVFTDPDGDKILQAYQVDAVELGTGYGTWHFIGGTGKHKGVSGRGTYVSKTRFTAGVTETRTRGVVTWPEN